MTENNEELEKNKCSCGEACTSDENHDCGCLHGEKCTCGENCTCGCQDGKPCTCEGECHCDENCECGCHDEEVCTCHDEKDRYLALAQQVQADFDNFRRRSREEIDRAKMVGQVSVIEAFLPCLDTFKEAKKSISDESVLQGVEMIENKILSTLAEIGVEKIESIGQVYSPHLHNVIAVMKDESKENDIILDEFQAGYKYKDKVIRYAKVIVNKKED